jgi:hypothetical protein
VKRRIELFLYPALLLLVNVLIAARLFRVEYSAYLESNEGTFIAIARQIARNPTDLGWWPYWDCGLPFQNTYLPLLHLMVAAWSVLARVSAALAFHQVAGALFCLGPVALYAMAYGMSHGIKARAHTSFLAAMFFSLFSPGAWFLPAVRTDMGGPWNLRRLQILAYYGEGPHIACLAFLPLAILFVHRSLTREGLRYRVLAGVFAGLTVLANAFGGVILAVACVCLLVTVRTDRFWRNLLMLGIIGALAYAWISPLAPPSVLAAIRANSPTVGDDYRFTLRSMIGVVITASGGAALWWASRRLEAHLRFFALYTWCLYCIVTLGVLARVFIVPQPHRYQVAMELGLCLTAVFGGAALLSRLGGAALRRAVSGVVLVACAAAFVHDRRYAHKLIQSTDMTRTPPYRIAQWMDGHMHGERVMVSGAYSFHFNDFTDTPQLHGGHDPMQPNVLIGIAVFSIYSGMNMGAEDAAIGTLWLQALGVHAISVPGPGSAEYYKPFANPRKFEGVLPVLWREGDDTIYAVPARSGSLAHVVPEDALVRRMPYNGLDIAELRRYVAGLENPAMPEAPLVWRNRHRAEVQVDPRPQTALSVQIRYAPGWRAWVGGKERRVFGDGLGFIAVRPECDGPCTVTLDYDGGPELRWTALASLLTMLGTGVLLGVRRFQSQSTRVPGLQPAP